MESLAAVMSQSSLSTSATDRVVARLVSEGWVNCPGLEFPALCKQGMADLRTFVLAQLQQAGNQMWETDLQLATLIFSIPAHEFQCHPGLAAALKQLESERAIDIVEFGKAELGKAELGKAELGKTVPRGKPRRAIRLKAIHAA